MTTKVDTHEVMPHVEGVRHLYLQLRGSRTHVAVAGPESAPPVVLLHGFPQHWWAWRDLLTALAADHYVVALDLPGFGWSDPSRHGYSTTARAEHVLALLDELGLDEVDLVGHDWGAWLAFRLALSSPRRVRRLVSIAELHPWPRQRRLLPALWRMWVTALFEMPGLGVLVQRRPRIIGWFLRRDAHDPSVWTQELTECYTRPAAHPPTARAGQRMHAAFIVHDIARLILRRDHPVPFDTSTLLLAGRHDAYIPPRLMEVPPGRESSLHVQVLHGGHFLLDENPTAVADAVRMHLGE